MPLDDETRRELEAIRAEFRDELRAATSSREREHVRSEGRADLEDVLRRDGYRLTRRELDELVSARDDARLEAKVEAMLAERERAAAETAEEDGDGGDGDGDGDGDGKKKPAAKKTPAKKPAGAADDETEEEWT